MKTRVYTKHYTSGPYELKLKAREPTQTNSPMDWEYANKYIPYYGKSNYECSIYGSNNFECPMDWEHERPYSASDHPHQFPCQPLPSILSELKKLESVTLHQLTVLAEPLAVSSNEAITTVTQYPPTNLEDERREKKEQKRKDKAEKKAKAASKKSEAKGEHKDTQKTKKQTDDEEYQRISKLFMKQIAKQLPTVPNYESSLTRQNC